MRRNLRVFRVGALPYYEKVPSRCARRSLAVIREGTSAFYAKAPSQRGKEFLDSLKMRDQDMLVKVCKAISVN